MKVIQVRQNESLEDVFVSICWRILRSTDSKRQRRAAVSFSASYVQTVGSGRRSVAGHDGG